MFHYQKEKQPPFLLLIDAGSVGGWLGRLTDGGHNTNIITISNIKISRYMAEDARIG